MQSFDTGNGLLRRSSAAYVSTGRTHFYDYSQAGHLLQSSQMSGGKDKDRGRNRARLAEGETGIRKGCYIHDLLDFLLANVQLFLIVNSDA